MIVHLIQRIWVTVILTITVVLEHQESNLRLGGLSWLHHIFLVDSTVRCTVVLVKKGGTNVLNIVRFVICSGIFLLRFLLEIIRFLLLLHQLSHQKVLLLFLSLGLEPSVRFATFQDYEASPDIATGTHKLYPF